MTQSKLWQSTPFWALSLGLFLNSYIYGVAASQAVWLKGHTVLLLAWGPLLLALGIGLGGVLADYLGRLKLLMGTPVLYISGSLLILWRPHIIGLLIGSALLLIAGGIESNTLITYAQELITPSLRVQALYTELNFVNLGGFVLAIYTWIAPKLPASFRQNAVAIVPLLLSVLSWVVRSQLVESVSWERHRGQNITYPQFLKFFPRLLVSSVFSLTNTSGFSLLTYAFGTVFFPHIFPVFLLISTGTAVMIGLSAPILAKWPVNRFLVYAYLLAAVSATAVRLHPNPQGRLFWLFIITLSAGTSLSYLGEDTFKSAHWPDFYRSRFTAISRIIGLSGYILILWVLNRQPFNTFLTVIAGLWWIGFLSALVWHIVYGTVLLQE
ncbi:hypothetical protein [Sulfobacillus thermosulfidooxidans]|uniref:hypothetical protein n=1 Tax=Sulfobacillus thermosulfidooxidans TaxID=28034 RepID=UPI00048BC7B1|nr:hypothetical protein [Sulfobacillus thermosulfidooxidans]